MRSARPALLPAAGLSLLAAAPLLATALPSTASTPARPTSVAVAARHGGLSLTWSSGYGLFRVEQAANSTFSTGRSYYTVRGQADQLTPYRVSGGHTYYFRVQAISGGASSAWSGAVHAVAPRSQVGLRVLTYNLLRTGNDGTIAASGATISPWSQRRTAAAALIAGALPDVIAVQEGSDWVGAYRGPRQVDDLVKALASAGVTYDLARTEIPPSEPHYMRTGRYILYRPSVLETVGSGWHWALGNGTWAAYQILQRRDTGTRFLFVSAHLTSGRSLTLDKEREQETKTLLADASAFASNHGGVPVIYAGDFNSHGGTHVALDGPAVVMRAHHIADTKDVAQHRTNTRYDSANEYYRTPPAWGENLDHIWAVPGVGVRDWEQLLHLSGGKFVGTIPSDHNPLVADLRLAR